MVVKFKITTQPKKSVDPEPELAQPVMQFNDFADLHLKYHLHKNNTSSAKARHHNVVHASDLDPSRQWCPREPALLTKFNKTRKSGFVSTSQKVVWIFGYRTADLVIDLLPDDQVWGHWLCIACGQTHLHQYRPERCHNCKAKQRALKYGEVFLKDPESGIVGSVDLFFDFLKNGVKHAIEIKSENSEGWKARYKADFDHEWRTKLYLWLVSKTDEMAAHGVSSDTARVFYVNKAGYADDPDIAKWKLPDWKKSPFKEYFVKRDDSAHENAREQCMIYRKWREAWEEGIYLELPAGICKSSKTTRAKNCDVCKECFS